MTLRYQQSTLKFNKDTELFSLMLKGIPFTMSRLELDNLKFVIERVSEEADFDTGQYGY